MYLNFLKFSCLFPFRDIYYGCRAISIKGVGDNQTGARIKQYLDTFLDQAQIRKDIKVIEVQSAVLQTSFAAIGTNYFLKGQAVVALEPGIYDLDRDASTFALKHEFGHIKHNDSIIGRLISGVAQLAAAVYTIAKMKFFPGLIITYLVHKIVLVARKRWQEIRADNFAIQHSSDEELLGGRRFFKALQQYNLSLRVSDEDKLWFSSTGEYRWDINHPSLQSRIEKIERVLRERNVAIDHDRENDLIHQLYQFMKNRE